MTYVTSNAASTRGTIEGEGLFARIGRSYADWRDYNRTLDELARLSDRELDDLGISRYDLPRIAREAVYG